MERHEFFDHSQPTDYDLGKALNMLGERGALVDRQLDVPWIGRFYGDANPFGPERYGDGVPRAASLWDDVQRLHDDRGFWKRLGHRLHVNGKELFTVTDATSEGAGGTIGVLLGSAVSAAGLPGVGELIATAGSAVGGSASGEATGQVSDRVEGAAREHHQDGNRRAERTQCYREVMTDLDEVATAVGNSLGSSTWHYRVALHIKEDLADKYWNRPARGVRADDPEWRPFVTDKKAGAAKQEGEDLAYFAYKVYSYMHHVEKVKRHLHPVLRMVEFVGRRAALWSYFWNQGPHHALRHSLSSLDYVLSPALAGDEHPGCAERQLCYPEQPLTEWVDLTLAKADVRGDRTSKTRKERLKDKLRRRREGDSAALLNDVGDEASTPETRRYDSFDEWHEARDGESVVEEEAIDVDVVEPEHLTDHGDGYRRYVMFAKARLTNPHGADASEARADADKPANTEFSQNPDGIGGDDLCYVCETDLAWLLHCTYGEVEYKPLHDRIVRKMGRKWKNADKKKMGITVGVAVSGVVVSIVTLGAATPVAIACAGGLAVTNQTAQKANQIQQTESLKQQNEANAANGSSSTGTAADVKHELKLDHRAIKTFSSKVRRHFKACEEAWASMMYFATARGTVQDRDDPSQYRLDSCFEAAQYAWAAKTFLHHYEKLQRYILPARHYAEQMLTVLEAWDREWDEVYPHYMGLIRRHLHCPHALRRSLPRGSEQVLGMPSPNPILADSHGTIRGGYASFEDDEDVLDAESDVDTADESSDESADSSDLEPVEYL